MQNTLHGRMRGWKRLATVLLLSGAVVACSPEPMPTPPPPTVEVINVKPMQIDNIVELPGRVQATRMAEVRARVTGIVARRLYAEGSDVKAGQPLFAIDPRELQANLGAYQAQLERAQATAANARQDFDRYRPLLKEQAISKQEYDAAVARMGAAEADVAQARAQVENAKLSLSYATVTAPISGRARRAEVTEGALVSASEGTLLTVIEQTNPVFVNFSQSSSELMAIRRDLASGIVKSEAIQGTRVELLLEDGTMFNQTGRLDFMDLSFDESTGVAALRAEFPNPGRILLPGQFVRARIFLGKRNDAILVPQRAVSVTQSGGSVMVVNSQNIAEARHVQLGDLRGSDWLIRSGLKAGDRVIVNGLMNVRPGAPVTISGGKPAAETPGKAPSAPAKVQAN